MNTSGLTVEQKHFYDENGYVVCRGLLPAAEAFALRQDAHDLAGRLVKVRNINAAWATVQHTKTVIQNCHDVQFYSAMFARLIVDPRFTAIAASIIGPNVQLHHTKMFIKPPEKGAPFPMHQDYFYFPHQRNTMIAAIFHFDDAPVERGCVRFVPGSHKLGPIPVSTPDFSLPPEQYPIENALPCPAKAGDVVLFNYLTIHGSGINGSSESRTTLLVQMRDPTDSPLNRTHESRGQGMMLAGMDPSCCTTKALEPTAQPSPV